MNAIDSDSPRNATGKRKWNSPIQNTPYNDSQSRQNMKRRKVRRQQRRQQQGNQNRNGSPSRMMNKPHAGDGQGEKAASSVHASWSPSSFSSDTTQSKQGVDESPRVPLAQIPVPAFSPSEITPESIVSLLNAIKSSLSCSPDTNTEKENVPSSAALPPTTISNSTIPISLPSLAPTPHSAENSSSNDHHTRAITSDPQPTIPAPKLDLIYHGVPIAYPLDILPDDPAVPLLLLNATQAHAGSYLLVGAYYRHTGRPEGASAVMRAFIQASKTNGTVENALRSAKLLLASCEHDLSRSATSTAQREMHAKTAGDLLRAVYGANTNTTDKTLTGRNTGKADSLGLCFEQDRPKGRVPNSYCRDRRASTSSSVPFDRSHQRTWSSVLQTGVGRNAAFTFRA